MTILEQDFKFLDMYVRSNHPSGLQYDKIVITIVERDT